MDEKDEIKDFYKKRFDVPDELDTKAVTSCSRKPNDIPSFVKEALELVHEDVISRSYGCSTAYPEALEGSRILDLGSGSGRDCFVLSYLVGQDGCVVGLDMTDEMLDLAQNKIQYHQDRYGYTSPNVSFIKGYMEKMEEAGLQENYFDVIVSNCVISLCQDKKAVLKEAAKVLKPYGEMYFSDMYRMGELPLDVMQDEALWCEGLTGSLTYQQLHDIAAEVGFSSPRLVKASELPVLDKSIKDRIGNVKYAAVTYRLFKKPTTTTITTANPPQGVLYKGGVRGSEEEFKFDQMFCFKKMKALNTDEETASILTHSRFNKYFERTLSQDEQDNHVNYQIVDPFSLL